MAALAEGDIYTDLATCPKGLATFGTPHRGSILATLAGLTSDFFKPIETIKILMGDEPALPEGYCDILRQGDDTSYIIGAQFFDRYRSAIPITSFYEMKAFHGIGKIVSEQSATLKDRHRKSNHRERRVGLNADHNGIVKFRLADRGLGHAVLAEIKSLADEVLASRSTNGLASGSTVAGTDGGDSGPSQSAAASWEEGSVQYFGDERDRAKTREDESIGPTDDGIDTEMEDDNGVDTEMPEAEFQDQSELGSTPYPRQGTASSSGPETRPHNPFNTHAMPGFATRSNIDPNQWGPHTIPIPPICFHCALSNDHQCPSHCDDCRKKRYYRPPIHNPLGNNMNQQSNDFLRRYWDEPELCKRHENQWSQIRDRPSSQRFSRSMRRPPFDQHESRMPAANVPPAFANQPSPWQYGPRNQNRTYPGQPYTPPPARRSYMGATPPHESQMPAANARPASVKNPQTSSQYGLRPRNLTLPRQSHYSPRPPSPFLTEEDEKKKRKGRNRNVPKTHHDHSEPSDAHTLQQNPRTSAQGSRRSERIINRQDVSRIEKPHVQPPHLPSTTASISSLLPPSSFSQQRQQQESRKQQILKKEPRKEPGKKPGPGPGPGPRTPR